MTCPITAHDYHLGTPPDDAVPDWLVDQLQTIERDCRGMLSDEVTWNIDGEPSVRWTIPLVAVGRDQRDAIADELEWIARLLRKPEGETP